MVYYFSKPSHPSPQIYYLSTVFSLSMAFYLQQYGISDITTLRSTIYYYALVE